MGGSRTSWSWALLLGFAFAIPGGSGAEGATLEDAVRLAVTTNPDVSALAADRRAVDHELRQARAGYFPRIDTRQAVGPEWTDRRDIDADSFPRWLGRSESQLTLRQLLFDGFETDSEVERQLSRVDSAAHRVGESAETTALNAVLAYLEVVRRQALVGIAEDNVKAHERTLEDVRRIAEAGRGNVADVRQTEARVAAARASLVQAQGDLQDAEANYIRVIGEPPEGTVRPVISEAALPVNRETAVDVAVRDNPTIAVTTADIATARAEFEATKSPFWPRLDLELGTQYDSNIDGINEHEYDFSALVVLRYNLYSGGLDTARREEFIERVVEAELERDRARRRVAEEARLAWNGMQTARGRTVRLAEQVEANERVVEAYREQFLIGRRDLLDVLDAQNELFVSRGSHVTADYTALFGAYRVLDTTGTLLGTLGIERPKDATPGEQSKGLTPASAEGQK